MLTLGPFRCKLKFQPVSCLHCIAVFEQLSNFIPLERLREPLPKTWNEEGLLGDWSYHCTIGQKTSRLMIASNNRNGERVPLIVILK
uniref:Uncharacterized protein n=1 Tax=Anopheles arabiensis TaxID=7173 RepID=A0A2C9GPC1_ANOAR